MFPGSRDSLVCDNQNILNTMEPQNVAPELATEVGSIATVVTVDVSDAPVDLSRLDSQETIVTVEDVINTQNSSQLEPILNLPFQEEENPENEPASTETIQELSKIVSSLIQ